MEDSTTSRPSNFISSDKSIFVAFTAPNLESPHDIHSYCNTTRIEQKIYSQQKKKIHTTRTQASRPTLANTTTMPTEISAPLHFRTLLNAHTYLIADFYATWCPPCKQIAPVYAQLSSTHSAAGKFAFVKVNVDEQRELAGQYGVTAMPTFMLFKDGKKLEEIKGADVRGLKGVIERVAGEVKGMGEKVKEKVEKKEEAEVEEQTVSGSYGMTGGNNWKMSLN